MMTISDLIEQMLNEMLSSSDGSVEIRRNILANQLNCVPSQINYVIKTRFTPERGYYIESRRGGGGSVTIRRVESGFGNIISLLIGSVGASLDYPTATAYLTRLFEEKLITKREATLMAAALSDKSILSGQKNEARAVLFKNMLITLIDN
ncbi:MAG: CtsR family transcriptional regulator [Clostridia bacterium]|nr:CtsR family transcriptional regulator [Clostridia bacterium]